MKKNKEETEKIFYGLNTQAIEDLAGADTENTPKYSQEELNKYKSKKGISIPSWLKALLIKYWFNGVVCFFFIWGLGMYIPNQLDLFVVTCIAMGFVTDILVNNIFRFYAKTEGENDRWMMFPKKSYLNLFLNIIYSFIVMLFVVGFYNVFNSLIVSATGKVNTVPFGVEPFSFGLIYLIFDFMFIGLKHLAKKILEDAKAKAYKGV